jgi:hypothetical protein
VGSEVSEVLYSTVEHGFPLPDTCDVLDFGIPSGDGVAYSYLNGLERYGETVAASASGSVQGLLLGAKDGTWSFVAGAASKSDLLVLPAPGLYQPMVQAPHSVLCTEGIDWGGGVGLEPGVLTCVAFHRRFFGGAQPCDTADFFRAFPGRGEVEYLASFPPPGFVGDRWAGCSNTNHHGNVALVGGPNPGGDGHTRLAMFTAASGALTMLDLTVTADSASIAFESVIAPEVESALSGWFATASDRLGRPHTLGTP